MRDLEALFLALQRSRFRSRFQLTASDVQYVLRKSLPTIRRHASDFVSQRLASAEPENDGRQTPMKGHPVFVAQHATGTCCRKCLAKWHGIESGRTLTDSEVEYLVSVIEGWISRQLPQDRPAPGTQDQLRLFAPDDPEDEVSC